jgi:DNA invertase Pin-like site-specific DNA recombinase
MRQIWDKGASLRSLAEGFDTKSATNDQIIEAMTAFERSLAGERIQIGMNAAKRRGQHVGRPRLLDDPNKVRLAAERVDAGEAPLGVATSLGVSLKTLQRAFQAHLQKARP